MGKLNPLVMELTKKFAYQYQKAKRKKEKDRILDQYCQLIKVKRNTAAKRLRKKAAELFYPRVLSSFSKKKEKRGRKKKYHQLHFLLIEYCWRLGNYLCAERLKPVLPVYLNQLEKEGKLKEFPQEIIN